MYKIGIFPILLLGVLIIFFQNLDSSFDDYRTVFAQEKASTQSSTYTNEKYGITIQYPSGWTEDQENKDKVGDEDSRTIEIVQFSKATDDYKGDVRISIDPEQGVSLNEYLSGTIENYKDVYGDFENFEIIDSSANTNLRLAGNPAYLLEYNSEDEFSNSDEIVKTRYLELGTKIGNDFYYVEYFAEEGEDYDKSLPLAQR